MQLRKRPRLTRLAGVREYTVGSGTLISRRWVLSVKHCLGKGPVTLIGRGIVTTGNGRIMVGDRRMGEGEPHRIKSIHKNPNADIALLELREEASAEHVVGYAGVAPNVYDEFQIRGWGLLGEEDPSPRDLLGGERGVEHGASPDVLQEMTVVVQDVQAQIKPEYGDRIQALDPGTGAIRGGDSGAGWYANGRIYAVTSTSEHEGNIRGTREYVHGIPTSDFAAWIQQVSGVAPSYSTT